MRNILTLLPILSLLLLPLHAEAKHKPKREPKVHTPRAGKGGNDGTALFDAMAQANRAGEMLEQMIIDVQSAGDDSRKIKEIADNYHTLDAAMNGEAEEAAKKLSKSEKKQVEAYRRAKITPLEKRWTQILARIETAVAAEVAEQSKQLRNQLEDLIAESEGIIAQTRSAGGDSTRRADLLQRLARLQASTHALYHDVAKVPGRKNTELLTKEIDEKLDPQVRRADWLLRMAVLPPCTEFTQQIQVLHKQVQELEGLVADYGLVVNRAGLNDLLGKRARLIAAIDATSRAALTPDETAELLALKGELMGPAQQKVDEAQNEASDRVGKTR